MTQNEIIFVFAAVLFLLMIKTGAELWEIRRKPRNPHGFGNGDDETDYEESNPNR